MDRTKREGRDRGLRRRGVSVRGTRKHSTLTCPECRAHIPVLSGFNEVPVECPKCGERFRCEACGGSLVEENPEDYEDGLCPRCEKPVTGEETGPGSEDFTWKDT